MRHVTLQTPMADDLSAGIVCFEMDGMTPEQVVRAFRKKKILAASHPMPRRVPDSRRAC